jgi:hypothetical protein
MEPQYLLSFLVRDIVKINQIKSTGKNKEELEEAKLVVKSKLINKENTLIFFDESHFAKNGSTTYTKIQELTQKLNYKVIRATAAFPGKPFSISMPKKGERKYMDGLVEKYKDNDDKEVDLNKMMAEGKLLVFLQKAELSDQQIEILKRENIGYLVFDETLELASTGLTYGCPNGYVFFGDDRYSMGFTFFINLCVSVVEVELKKLNSPISIASKTPNGMCSSRSTRSPASGSSWDRRESRLTPSPRSAGAIIFFRSASIFDPSSTPRTARQKSRCASCTSGWTSCGP